MPKSKESLFYGLLHGGNYVLIKATSEQSAREHIKRRYPECDVIVGQKQFSEKLYPNELMRIRVEPDFDDEF
jgi:hypothetical protein